MKKILIILVAVFAIIGAFSACGGSDKEETAAPADTTTTAPVEEAQTETTDDQTAAQAEETPTAANEADFDGCHVVITGHKVASDYEGKPMLVIEYAFTNNTDENKAPIWEFYHKAFQNGIELDTAIGMDSSVYDAGIEQKTIQPGTTLEGCQIAYSLTDTSPVDFTGGGLFDQELIKMTFDVQQ